MTTASKITDGQMLDEACRNLLAVFKQPVLVETYLPGREFTVGIVGNGDQACSVGVMEVILLSNADAEVYSYRNKEFCEELVDYRAVNDSEAQAAVKTALASYRVLGCCDAARVDLRSDSEGRPHFIEINPLAGLHPEHSDLCIIATKHGISYQELMGSIVGAAIERCGLKA